MDTLNLKKYVILLLFILLKSAPVVYSQEDYQAQMDNIFNIPAQKVTTGVLINRSPDVIEMQILKLQSNANNATVINTHNWLELFYRLYASHLNMNSFLYDITLANKYAGKTAHEQIPLGLIYYCYDKIKNNAVQNGLLSVDTVSQKITDISPVGQSPLEVDTCFAASLLVDTLTAGTNAFILKDSLFVSNKKSDIQSIYANFDNGQGYVRMYPNQPVTVSYTATGNKTLTTRIVVGSKNYYTSSRLYVKEPPPQSPLSTNSDVPRPDFGPEPYDNSDIKAYYGIWYRCNHNSTIRKPILIVSGFDPSDMIRIAGEEADQGAESKAYLYNIANKNGFLDSLRELGYDIIVYRSADSDKSVIDNAMNLVNFMQEKIINVKTSNNELIVLGASMGGLVCRYALTYMEKNNIPHKTKLFISMDSPQNGANVPLGFQYMAFCLNDDLKGLVPDLSDAIKNQLSCNAAKEMLIYHYAATAGNTAKCHPKRTEYLNSLASIGNFPKQCTTMAISFGSGVGTTQGFPAGATLIKKNSSPLVTTNLGALDFLLTLVGIPPTIGITLNSATWEFEVNAVPDQTSKSIYKETISLDICIPKTKVIVVWTPLPVPVIVPYLDCGVNLLNRNVVVNNTMPLDNAPASIKNWHNFADFDYAEAGRFLNLLGVTSIDQHSDAFIPAYSALGLSVSPHTNIRDYLNGQANVQRLSATSANYHFYRNSNPAVSPFNYLYIENRNDEHIFNSNNEAIFSEDLLKTLNDMIFPHQLSLENKTITSGQSVAYEALNVTATNVTVKSGGRLDITANEIILNPGFNAEIGSTVHINADVSWICPTDSVQFASFSPLSRLNFVEVAGTENPIRLQQNTPDPFTQNTRIDFYLPNTVQQADLYVYDTNQAQIMHFPLSERGEGSLTIQGQALAAGMYLYVLIADGVASEAKRMILTN